MRAHKLGVIVPVSREFLQYSVTDFFTQVRPLIAEAFYKKFDEATISGVDNPYTQSLQNSVSTAGNIVTGDISGESFFDLTDQVNDAGFTVNGYISNTENRFLLRRVVDGYQQTD